MSPPDKSAEWFDWAEECESLPIYHSSSITPVVPPTSNVSEESYISSSTILGSTTDGTAATSSTLNTATVTTGISTTDTTTRDAPLPDDNKPAGWFEPSTDTEISTQAQPVTDAELSSDKEPSSTEVLANADAVLYEADNLIRDAGTILRDAAARYDRYPIQNGSLKGAVPEGMCPFAVRTIEEPHNIVPLMVLLGQEKDVCHGRPIPGVPIPFDQELWWSLDAHRLFFLEWHALDLLEKEQDIVAAIQALRKRNIGVLKDYIHQRNLYRVCLFANDKNGMIAAVKTVANDMRRQPTLQRLFVETALCSAVGRERARDIMDHALSLDRAGAHNVSWFVGYNDVELEDEDGRVYPAIGLKPYALPLLNGPQVTEGLLSKPIRCRIHAIIWPRFHPACMVKFFRQDGKLYAEPEPKLTDKPEEFSNLTILREGFRDGRRCWKLDGRE